MTSSFLKNIVKEIDNDYAGLLSEGGVGDIESYIDTGSYIFNALVSGSIHKGIASNKITALAGESGTGKTFFCLGVVFKVICVTTLMRVLFILKVKQQSLNK